jgi:sensor histidine kinase regulating citrate/malate metabolism
MEDMDLYSLFGNAISNAMESVSQLDDVHKRHISLKVREVGDLVSIHVENYYDGKLEFVHGLPQTSKDRNYHGYGMKSMERIVSSYGGTMNITTQDQLFKLDILLPKKS